MALSFAGGAFESMGLHSKGRGVRQSLAQFLFVYVVKKVIKLRG
jgi:hypothetical protein